MWHVWEDPASALKKGAEVLMNTDTEPEVIPRRRYRPALNSVARVREELAKVYRAARNGEIALSDATRLTYMLDKLARMLVDQELESRIEALENVATGTLPGREAHRSRDDPPALPHDYQHGSGVDCFRKRKP
jgi:hypothetical protein